MVETLDALTLVMAGGNGSRLDPLTKNRTKPDMSVWENKYIDFVIGNLWLSGTNAGIKQEIIVLTQGPLSPSLDAYVDHVWASMNNTNNSVRIVKPQNGTKWNGTIECVAHNLEYIKATKPKIVRIFAADHAYVLDVLQMDKEHHESGADFTICSIPVTCPEGLGTFSIDKKEWITGFEEKSQNPKEIPDMPGRYLASMGNYAVKPEVLQAVLADYAAKGITDIGKHLISYLLQNHYRVKSYDFNKNSVPGATPGYWKDAGTRRELHKVSMDIADGVIILGNPQWQFPTNGVGYADSTCEIALPSHVKIPRRGCIIGNASLDHVVLSHGTTIQNGAVLNRVAGQGDNYIGSGAVVVDAILEQGAIVPDNVRIGPNEQPLPGVVVLDGLAIVTRDAFSNYRINSLDNKMLQGGLLARQPVTA